MKALLCNLLLIFSFILCLLFPAQTLEGAVSGLMLWYEILLPTLLPFIIITTLIVKTNSFLLINKLLGPVLQRIFQTSNAGSFVILVGFLCGYPMGAKVINDLYKAKALQAEEAQYLLSFCNNTSPMFLISFVINQALNQSSLAIPIIVSVYLAPIILSFLARQYYKYSKNESYALYNKTHFSIDMLDSSIMEGILLITKIGGYIMLFSIIICLTNHLFSAYIPLCQYLLSLLEITNGIHILASVNSVPFQILAIIFLVSFGGICSIAQTKCVLDNGDLKIFPYVIQKIITANIAVIIGLVIILI